MSYREKLSHIGYNQKIGLTGSFTKKNVKKIQKNNTNRYEDSNESEDSSTNHSNMKQKYDKRTRLKSCYTSCKKNPKDSDIYCDSDTNSTTGLKKGQKLLKHFEDVFEKYLNEEFESRNSFHKREEPTIEKLIDSGDLYKLSDQIKKAKRKLTEQDILIGMEKPPLDKLKHIPIKFLKPRVPARLMTKKTEETSFAQSEVEKKCSEEYIEPCNYSDIEHFDGPEPYLHPNIEKMFLRETTEKLMRSQDETNIEPKNNELQKKLFKEMPTERKSSFVIDLKITKNENWREVLEKQEKIVKTNLLPRLKKESHTVYCSGVSLDKIDQSTDGQEVISDHNSAMLKLVKKVVEPNIENLVDSIHRCKEPSYGGGDTLYTHKLDETQKQKFKELFDSIINSNLQQIDFPGCLHIMETLTQRMELNIFSKSTNLSEKNDRLMVDHLRQIQREIVSLKNLNGLNKNSAMKDGI